MFHVSLQIKLAADALEEREYEAALGAHQARQEAEERKMLTRQVGTCAVGIRGKKGGWGGGRRAQALAHKPMWFYTAPLHTVHMHST